MAYLYKYHILFNRSMLKKELVAILNSKETKEAIENHSDNNEIREELLVDGTNV